MRCCQWMDWKNGSTVIYIHYLISNIREEGLTARASGGVALPSTAVYCGSLAGEIEGGGSGGP